jgi:hypothetical protein
MALRYRGLRWAVADLPVGAGAEWTLTEADSPGGVDVGVPVALRLTLVSLEDTDYRIEFTVDGDASRPFDQRWTMEMSMDTTFTEDDIAIGVDATIRYEHVSTTR